MAKENKKKPTIIKKKSKKETKSKQPAYLRKIEIKYRKLKVKAGSPIGKPIKGAKTVVDLFSFMQNEAKEKFVTISLDAKLKINCFEVVAIGSLNSIYVRPFESLRASIALNAHGVIVVHNHPSGDPTPRKEDKTFTKKLKKLTELGGMKLHDHIIIGDEKYYSFSEERLLDKL